MTDKKKDLTFAEFYLTEFFKHTLTKGNENIPAEYFEILEELSTYLLAEENLVNGLEKLAQYQGTSEFAIFLFDMIDRIQDYSPYSVYATVPDLAEDFINLYVLMIEDPESVSALQAALALFREKQPIKMEAVLEPVSEIEEPTHPEDLLSVEEFLQIEMSRQMEETLGLMNLSEKYDDYRKLYDIFQQFFLKTKREDLGDFHSPIPDIYENLQQLNQKKDENVYSPDSLDTFRYEIKQLVENFNDLEESNPGLLATILKSGRVPKKEKVSAVEHKPEEEMPYTPVTIDQILHDYFKSEVDEHITLMRNAMQNNIGTETIDEFVRQLKSLKEVSMIHGYTGLEHFTGLLIETFNQARKKKQFLSSDSMAVLERVFNELESVEKYNTANLNEEQLDLFTILTQELSESFTSKVEKPKKEKAEKVRKPAKQKEVLIALTDREQIFPVLKELFAKTQQKINKRIKDIKNEDILEEITGRIQSLGNGAAIFLPELPQNWADPLSEAYRVMARLPKKKHPARKKLINKIWEETLEGMKDPFDLSALQSSFESILDKPREELYSLLNDDKISSALVEVSRAGWQKIADQLESTISEKDALLRKDFWNYFSGLSNNFRLIGYHSYIPVIDFIADLFTYDQVQVIEKDIAQEIGKSFELILDRIQLKGKSGSCDDVLAVLKENIQEQKPVFQPTAQTQPELVVEEDVETIFVNECNTYIQSVHQALDDFEKNPKERNKLLEIENAMHAIRSSAHLLNKSTISNTAALVEDACEIFGKSAIAIPDKFSNIIRSTVQDLERLMADGYYDNTQSLTDLQAILDDIVIEDIKPEESTKRQPGRDEHKLTAEKPLFSEEVLDEELLEIFRDEAKDLIATLRESNNILMENPADAQAVEKLDNAAHLLKSAAKMMGFREIGQITDSLEALMESIKDNTLENSVETQENIKKAIDVIDQLSKGQEVESAVLSGIINDLEMDEFMAARADREAAQKPADERVSVDISQVFMDEAHDLLEKIYTDLLELEKMPESETILTNLLRNLHTLKGSAMMARFETIGELCHNLEDAFDVYKTQNTEIKEKMLHPVFSAFDLISEMIETYKTDGEASVKQFTSKMAEIDNKLFLFQNFDLGADTGPASRKKITPVKTGVKKAREEDNIIKITTSDLDNLVNLSTEMLVNRTELTSYFDHLKKIISEVDTGKKQIYQSENLLDDILDEKIRMKDSQRSSSGVDAGTMQVEENLQNVSINVKEFIRKINSIASDLNRLSQGLERNISRIAHLSKDLHSDILKARMVPIEQLFNRFARPVRDMALEQNKQINLVIEDNEAEMDRAMVEALVDPILHIIRNAIDHGIETPKERQALKKDKKGTIILRASQEKNQIAIDVIDDGRGIDIEKVKKTIVKNKMATRKDIDKLSEAEILDYLFLPEFSTREKTTDISGRGIGLNVVSNQIQKLKGIIRIKTEPNAGTTFSIRLPLTLVVSQALMIQYQGQHLAIPVAAVQESIQLDSGNVLVDDDRKYLKVRGKLLPFINLDEILHFEEAEKSEDQFPYALVLHDAGISMALGVTKITGRQEIVIKSLGTHLQNIEYISGGTILGNGEVALILDYAAVVRNVEAQYFGRLSEKVSLRVAPKPIERKAPPPVEAEKETVDLAYLPQNIIKKKVVKDRKAQVLIVDDSISVRNFVSSVLEKQGFSTIKSSDGASAVKRLEKDVIDLVITDLEMPKMHGFELIQKIRNQSSFKNLPIVILTGKTGQSNRAKATELGANAFIVKPFKENDLINVLNKFIEIKQ